MTLNNSIRSYLKLQKLTSFESRYEYLRLTGIVGEVTFGFDRYLNQILYRTKHWAQARDKVILRDSGCDLGIAGYEISGKIIIHHMNPITVEDVRSEHDDIFDPEFLICVSYNTHQAIHYGDKSLLPQVPIKRYPGDTCPWHTKYKE